MSKDLMLKGSIDIDRLSELVKAKHGSVFTTAQGKRMMNVTIWVNDTPNDYGQRASLSVWDKSSNKTDYLGNFGLLEEIQAAKDGVTSQYKESSVEEDDSADLPF